MMYRSLALLLLCLAPTLGTKFHMSVPCDEIAVKAQTLSTKNYDMNTTLLSKDEKIENTSMGSVIDDEEFQHILDTVNTCYMTEIAGIKKKYETDISKLQEALNGTNDECLTRISALDQKEEELEIAKGAHNYTIKQLDDEILKLSDLKMKLIADITGLQCNLHNATEAIRAAQEKAHSLADELSQ